VWRLGSEDTSHAASPTSPGKSHPLYLGTFSETDVLWLSVPDVPVRVRL